MFDFDAEKSRVAVVVVVIPLLYNVNNEFNLCNSVVSVFIFVVRAVVMYSASVHVFNSW